MKVIAIDPGHGGWDSGAIAIDGVAEKVFNLELGLALEEALGRYDCRVVMTRRTDTALAPDGELGLELRARADVANREGAALLISLHHDSAGTPQARGGSLWIWTDKAGWLPAEGNHKAPNSYRIALQVYPAIRECLAGFGIPWRGDVHCSNFGVLRNCNGPAILLECFFGSNATDLAAARRPEFIPALATSLADALAHALELPAVPPPEPADPPAPVWDPAAEIAAALQAGLINTPHDPDAPVTWGQLATVLNRVLQRIR